MAMVMADAVSVALFRLMLPVPLTVSDPLLIIEILPVELLVTSEPELFRVPLVMLIAMLDAVAPAGADAIIVPELLNVPEPMLTLIVEDVPAAAAV
jgi:hypothetical protein